MDFYIINSKCLNYYKVGVSKCFWQRYDQHKSAAPFEILIFYACKLKNEYSARAMERVFLLLFESNKSKGEWFYFDINGTTDAERFCSFVELIEKFRDILVLNKTEGSFSYLVENEIENGIKCRDVRNKALMVAKWALDNQ